MPFTRPTRSQLLALARAEIDLNLPGADARLRRSFLDTIARIHTAQVHGLYGYLAHIERNAYPETAELERLVQVGGLYGVPEAPATFASGPVTFAGTNGLQIEAGAKLRRSDGAEYALDATATIASGTATVDVTCTEAGLDGNTDAGVTLRLVSPLLGIATEAVVASGGIRGGDDTEEAESFRARLQQRIQHPPAGGTVSDYEQRVLLYPEVTHVFVHALQFGDGTVGIAPLFYDREDPIPEAGDVSGIQALVTAAAWKPVCALITTYALTPVPVDFGIDGVTDPVVQAAIAAELRDLFRREARPGGVLLISHIREAISGAAGEEDHDLVTPTANIDLADDLDEISVLGAIDWTP